MHFFPFSERFPFILESKISNLFIFLSHQTVALCYLRSWKKMLLPIIWIERIPLLRVYFSHFIAKQGTILKNICFKQGTKFCSAYSSSSLIYYGPANCSFRRQITRELFYYCLLWSFSVFLSEYMRDNYPEDNHLGGNYLEATILGLIFLEVNCPRTHREKT